MRKIPGIGPKTEEVLAARNIFLIKDIKKLSKEELIDMLGKWGESLYDKARGRDESPLVTEWIEKSIGEQETFQKDTLETDFLLKTLDCLCEDVFGRFKLARNAAHSVAGGKSEFESFRSITITVRFADFETKTRARTVKEPVSDLKILEREALKLFMPFLDKRENPSGKKIRLLGVRVEKLL